MPALQPKIKTKSRAVTLMREWVEGVVLGLGLCPFAQALELDQQLRIVASGAADAATVLADLDVELDRLAADAPSSPETTIIAIPWALAGFDEFNDFLGVVDDFLNERGWSDSFQIASFHPDYTFADANSSDRSNYTNRSPLPALQILKVASVARALEAIPDAGVRIPAANIATLDRLTAEEFERLWPNHSTMPV